MLNRYNKVIKMDSKNFNADSAYIPKSLSNTSIKNHVYNFNGKNYYAKSLCENEDEDMVINELIGSYLAKLIDLDAVDYEIGIMDYDNDGKRICLLSELFYEKDFDYEYAKQYNYNFLLNKLKKAFFIDNLPTDDKYLRDSLLKLSLLDIKMIQFDRYVPSNIMIKRCMTNNFVDLAPAYDFGFAYPSVSSCNQELFELYTNYFLTLRTNKQSLELLLKKYPQAYDTLYKLAITDINTVLNAIEEEKEIIIDKDIKEHIISEDKTTTKVLKRLI